MKKLIALILTLCLAFSLALPAFAGDKTSPKGYLVLGENLSSDQQKQVLDYFGVEDREQYHVSYSTNQQEHKAFDDYLPASVIGSKAVSSILLIPKEEGSGITIHTSHITYVTKEMYQSALITSGVKDVEVYVAAPFDVSGTAALLGAMNAYGTMTGKSVDDSSADAAIDELVTTGEIADALNDKETAVELIALLKQYLAEHGDEISDEELSDAIDQICVELKITPDDNMKAEIIALLRKLQKTDIDTETLKQQAGALYDSISGMLGLLSGAGEKAANSGFFQKLLAQIIAWFSGLFGG
jgi:uncharacterized protein YpuA (DUF1002 family)